MNKNNPLISVFIPYYNDEKYLKESIESVLNQTYDNFELILLNHASTDNSREIAHSYTDKRIKHIDMTVNYLGGGGLLLREFLKVARGKYLKFFCADDIMLPFCLEALVNYMQENPEKDFAFGDVEYINARGISFNKTWFNTRPNFDFKDDEAVCIRKYFDGKSFLPYIGCIVKNNIIDINKLDFVVIQTFDMYLWSMLLCQGCKLGYLDMVIAEYRIHDSQLCCIKDKRIIDTRVNIEKYKWVEVFFNLKDVKIAKKAFYDSEYIEKLTDADDIPFIVAELYFRYTRNSSAYFYLHKLVSEEQSLIRLNEKFGYSIRELRDTYMKEFSFAPLIKTLPLNKLLFFTFRKIWKIITLQELFKYFKMRNELTL